MNTFMYPFGPDDDFPQAFCAIRPYSGERQLYTPESERTSDMLSRMHKEAMGREETIKTLTDGNQRLRIDNAMLWELCDELIDLAQAVKADSKRLAELQRHALHLRMKVVDK